MPVDPEETAAMAAPTMIPAPRFSDSPNARSKTITTAPGSDTHGILNQHLEHNLAYQVGVADEIGQRRTMEDAYSFVVDFGSIRGQGYFAVFDGHAGKYAAEWCGSHFHEVLLQQIHDHPDSPIPDVLNHTFHSVDSKLSAIAQQDDKMHSGCTAVTAFLRIEDAQGGQGFLPPGHMTNSKGVQPQLVQSPTSPDSGNNSSISSTEGRKNKSPAGKIVDALKTISGTTASGTGLATPPDSSPSDSSPGGPDDSPGAGGRPEVFTPGSTTSLRRVLYTANAGDARAVLCRAGKAVRLTYDHKGSDKQEAKRIMDAGGFVMSGRVNGVLAVTRSLGDSSMKDFVVGSPYTTETELGDDDEFLILACDGLWDVASDQEAVELVKDIIDAQEASKALVKYAINELSSDNITVIVVRFPKAGAQFVGSPTETSAGVLGGAAASGSS